MALLVGNVGAIHCLRRSSTPLELFEAAVGGVVIWLANWVRLLVSLWVEASVAKVTVRVCKCNVVHTHSAMCHKALMYEGNSLPHTHTHTHTLHTTIITSHHPLGPGRLVRNSPRAGLPYNR